MADDHPFPAHESTCPRVTDLTWALVDERITDEEMATLESLLLNDECMRNEYLRCIQLHADLQACFGEKPSKPDLSAEPPSQVLGLPNKCVPPLDLSYPPTAGTTS